MNNFRSLYKVFKDTRKAARERATLAIVGDDPRTVERLAALTGAQTNMRGAEVVLTVSNGKVSLSGKGVEDAAEFDLPVNLDDFEREVVPGIVKSLEDDYMVSLSKGYPYFRREVCSEIIRSNARQNAVVGALPIPGADLPVMTANQGRMVLLIAAAFGEELSFQRARELFGVVAVGFGLRAVVRQVAKFVPVAGWAASAAIGYAGTVAMGRATVLYFERGHQKVGAEEMERIRERAAREAKGFVDRMRDRRKGKQ
ncbi:MAG: YcjF family protein [Rubrobacter sp.]